MGDQWEIAVPKRKLKKYLYTISLGLYRGEILVPEVSNLRLACLCQLDPHDTLYGRMMVTISEGKDECEFYLDLDKLAAKFGMDANEFKTLAAQFGRIGQEWLIIAGASSGSWIGVGLSCAAVAGVWLWRKKREEAAK